MTDAIKNFRPLFSNNRSTQWILFLARVAVGTTFVYASVDKILFPLEFAVSIHNYRVLPAEMTNLSAVFLPWLELYCGLFLLFGIWTRPCALVVAVMLLVFAAAYSSTLVRGLDISCGCFPSEAGLSQEHFAPLVRNVLLLLITIPLVLVQSTFVSIEHLFRRPAGE